MLEDDLMIGSNSAKDAFLGKEEQLSRATNNQMNVYRNRDKQLGLYLINFMHSII